MAECQCVRARGTNEVAIHEGRERGLGFVGQRRLDGHEAADAEGPPEDGTELEDTPGGRAEQVEAREHGPLDRIGQGRQGLAVAGRRSVPTRSSTERTISPA